MGQNIPDGQNINVNDNEGDHTRFSLTSGVHTNKKMLATDCHKSLTVSCGTYLANSLRARQLSTYSDQTMTKWPENRGSIPNRGGGHYFWNRYSPGSGTLPSFVSAYRESGIDSQQGWWLLYLKPLLSRLRDSPILCLGIHNDMFISLIQGTSHVQMPPLRSAIYVITTTSGWMTRSLLLVIVLANPHSFLQIKQP